MNVYAINIIQNRTELYTIEFYSSKINYKQGEGSIVVNLFMFLNKML